MKYYCGPNWENFPGWARRILSYKFNASCRVHDLDYRATSKYTQKEADRRFLRHMLKQAGWNPFWILVAYAYYIATRILGWTRFGKKMSDAPSR